MKNILIHIAAVDMLLYNLHYRANGGASFYAQHLLADKVREELDPFTDDINESYFLGERNSVPLAEEIVADAITIVNGFEGDDFLVKLNNALSLLAAVCEDVKREGNLSCGASAIVDNVSIVANKWRGITNRAIG